MKSVREKILAEAINLTTGDRQRDYGDVVTNMSAIARIFNAITGQEITAEQVPLFHLATKLARLQHSPDHWDSHVDAAAYIAIHIQCLAEKTYGDSDDLEG